MAQVCYKRMQLTYFELCLLSYMHVISFISLLENLILA